MYVLKSFLSIGLYRMCESILTAATWEIINGMKIPEGAFCSICLRSNGRSHIVIASGIFKHLIDPLAVALRTKLFNPAYAALKSAINCIMVLWGCINFIYSCRSVEYVQQSPVRSSEKLYFSALNWTDKNITSNLTRKSYKQYVQGIVICFSTHTLRSFTLKKK